ncbi:MAG: transaldolase [Bacteroides sp. SM23_62_1]|nr:MAG: transaldolase [Bacteroides sp. SM23_62_1]
MNLLEQLKQFTEVVADTGDFQSIVKFRPVDATTNPSLIFAAVQNGKYYPLVEDAVSYAQKKATNREDRLQHCLDKIAINFGIEILKIVPRRVSTEVDARLSFDVEGTIEKARRLIALYQEEGVDRSRVLIKIASTWEGIRAAQILEQEGVHCNLTLLFSMPQAIACAEAGVQLISPFVGRIYDWYKRERGVEHIPGKEDPGVNSVHEIYKYFKKFGYKTEIMGASFRNTEEIIELAGCDLLTISPSLLDELEKEEGLLTRKLSPEMSLKEDLKKISLDEKTFRWILNGNAMATEKLAEGIRRFTDDLVKLEYYVASKI